MASLLVSPRRVLISLELVWVFRKENLLKKISGIPLHSIGWGIQLHGIGIGIAQPRPNGCDIAQEGISSAPAFS